MLAAGSCGGQNEGSEATGSSPGAPRTVNGSVPAPLVQPDAGPTGAPSSRGANEPRSVGGSVPGPSVLPGAEQQPETVTPESAVAEAAYTARSGKLTPTLLTLPVATPGKLTLISGDDRTYLVRLRGPRDYSVRARPGSPGSVALDPLPPGRYRLTLGSSVATLLVEQPGP